jgi:hypothetical protein
MVLNPATEEVIGTVPDATEGDVNLAAAARRAFDEGTWTAFSPRERAAFLLRMADVMERRAVTRGYGRIFAALDSRACRRVEGAPNAVSGREISIAETSPSQPRRATPGQVAAAICRVTNAQQRDHLPGRAGQGDTFGRSASTSPEENPAEGAE